ncbi:MAG: hypothetical protein IJW19_01240 [Clostridia bacterium]|nr:hypothetical protein [Clostridia bacterium]
MKRFFALFLIFISLFSISCKKETYNILPFENRNVYAECTVNGKFRIIIEKIGNDRYLRVLSPTELSGVEFFFSETESYVISGDIKIPTDRKQLDGIYALSSLFNINEAMLTSAVSENGKGNLTFQNEGCEYTLIFNNKGELSNALICGDGYEYNVVISLLKIE